MWCEGSHIAVRKKLSRMIISLYLIFVLLRTVSNYHQHFGNQKTLVQTLNNFPVSTYCTYIFYFFDENVILPVQKSTQLLTF